MLARALTATAALAVLGLGLTLAIAQEKPAVRPKPDAAAAKSLDAGVPEPTHVKLSFRTTPSVPANVYYGRKLLGTTPFSLQWKKDSGPLDLVVRASGFLPVYTRAYTWTDDDLTIKLTRPDNRSKLFGYKEKLDGGVDDEGEVLSEDIPD